MRLDTRREDILLSPFVLVFLVSLFLLFLFLLLRDTGRTFGSLCCRALTRWLEVAMPVTCSRVLGALDRSRFGRVHDTMTTGGIDRRSRLFLKTHLFRSVLRMLT